MPTKLFDELGAEKRERIMAAGIAEFAKYGYSEGSTNRIVKNSGISKGSLFQYFVNKEELYFYILDSVTLELAAYLDDKASGLSKDLFERIIEYSNLEIFWYMQNPEKYKIIIGAFARGGSAIHAKIQARYGAAGDDMYYKLLEDVDWQMFKWNREVTVDILKWFLKGFSEDFMSGHAAQGSKVDEIRGEYVKRLAGYMEALKTGLLR